MPKPHAPRPPRRSFAASATPLLLAPIASLGVACGGAPPPAPAAPAPVAVATPAPAPAADVSAVPEPKSLLVFARVAKPQHVLDVISAWTGVAGLGPDAVAELVSGEAAGAVVDLAQPIDVAIAADSGVAGPRVSYALSIAAKPDARAVLSEHFELVERNGVTRLHPKEDAGDDDDDDRKCALFSSAGASKLRLVCAGSDGALTALGPYLARTAPRASFPADVHIDARLDSVRPAIAQSRALLPTLAASALGSHRPNSPAVGEMINAVVGDVVDLALDLDKISFDAQMGEPGASATLTTSFRDAKSLLAKVATSHPERGGAPPPSFWHLPVDADAAFFRREIDASLLARPRDLAVKAVGDALDKSPLPPADRKSITDALSHVADLFGAGTVHARGIDGADVQKKLAAVKQAKDAAARDDAEQAAADALAGWTLVGIDQPIAKVGADAKELVAAVSRPATAKWIGAEMKDIGTISLRSVPVAAKLKLPKDSLELELTSRRMTESTPAPPPEPKRGAKPAPPPKPAAPKLGKPTTVRVLIVPDAGRTWLAFGADDALLASKVRTSLTGEAEAGTLAKREGLDELRTGAIASGGFLTVRGIVTGAVPRWVRDRPGSFSNPLGALSAEGAGAPIPVTIAHRPGDGTPGAVSLAAKLPRAAIQEIMTAALHR